MIDLHTHSTASDGQYSPEKLVELAKDANLSAFSVSDHDTVEGSVRAVQRGKELGVQVIPAVEISVSFRGKALHILGYDFDLEDTSLTKALYDINVYRRNRAQTMVGNINQELVAENMKPMDIDTILRLGIEKPINRVDLAQYLLENGYVHTIQEAFDKWLNRHNIPNIDFSVKQAIEMIRGAGWVAVLAHPGSENISLQAITANFDEQVQIIMDFQSEWLDGIEVYRYNQPREIEAKYAWLANSLGLIATGWSDFHGPRIIGIAPNIGNNSAPDEVVDRILEMGVRRKY